MAEPEIAQKSPFIHKVEEDGKLAWCSCGKSQKQPFCDGAHAREDTGMTPVKIECAETKRYALCGCKHTAGEPFCDGAHSEL